LTHSGLISHIYSNISTYLELWKRRREETGECGAFVFLPGRDLSWEWWSLVEIRDYVEEGGLDDREVLEGLSVFDEAGEDFLVLVIEHVDGAEQQKAHFHKISRGALN
jgi:hypothetical protein